MSTLRTAILFHEPPHEPAHFDWLVETVPARPLACWRVDRRIDALALSERINAQRIADHHPKWLNLSVSEPLSGDRGRVSPCEHGVVHQFETRPDEWILTIEWAAGTRATYRLLTPDSPEATLCRVQEASP